MDKRKLKTTETTTPGSRQAHAIEHTAWPQGTQAPRDLGTQGPKNPGTQGPKNQGNRNPGTQELRDPGTPTRAPDRLMQSQPGSRWSRVYQTEASPIAAAPTAAAAKPP
eukprot:CAMPEP_0204384492 /NCGR_PEP_ID=MMETSP0469-20131031/56914_1 /ASSEMBLY_ACC=CAM_ASM_000384 /TAXON_ID=2969 /ORGANISM="Oxyrrhis marina" /LENGTH=108 /DNA_ID=CAMNT_0051377129 /DNA_START=35 /DNA_END=358 /DNA_ORIENTATION=+